MRLLVATAMAFWLVAIVGCASYSQLFVNSNGDVVPCSATGQGLVGMAVASNAVNDCSANMRLAGYVELERAGVLGITLSDTSPGEPIRILKVTAGSPAAIAGILPGDTIDSIEGQPAGSKSDANQLLFGLAGTDVEVTIQRAGEQIDLEITRAPYTEIYGVAATEQKPSTARPGQKRRGGMIP